MKSRSLVIICLAGALLSSCSLHKKKYENPITKDTKQPDKVLFDKAVGDIERSRYEVARITLNTLINTYDQSEFLAKAKLAIADSWYREGGAHGLAQAEAEYKDFILFYPTLEEAAEAQKKVCLIHYKQMEKADRDPNQALRAEDECRQLLVQFPNSKFAPEAEQLLRNIQEGLANGEHRVGTFYAVKGSNPAATNRLGRLVDQYPLYSHADEALFQLGTSYGKMGPRFRAKAGEAYAKIIRDYPLSPYAEDAKRELNDMELPIPEADPAAVARMKYEEEHSQGAGMISKSTGFLKRGPDVHTAARSGAPAMTTIRPTIPASVPAPVAAASLGTNDVTASMPTDTTALDTGTDARQNPPAATATATPTAAAPAAQEPPVTNHVAPPGKPKKVKKAKKQTETAAPAPAAATPAAAPPATPPAAPPATPPNAQ